MTKYVHAKERGVLGRVQRVAVYQLTSKIKRKPNKIMSNVEIKALRSTKASTGKYRQTS